MTTNHNHSPHVSIIKTKQTHETSKGGQVFFATQAYVATGYHAGALLDVEAICDSLKTFTSICTQRSFSQTPRTLAQGRVERARSSRIETNGSVAKLSNETQHFRPEKPVAEETSFTTEAKCLGNQHIPMRRTA